jgi:hypothetical protein
VFLLSFRLLALVFCFSWSLPDEGKRRRAA